MSNLAGYLNKGPQHTLSLQQDTNLSFRGKRVNVIGTLEIDRWHVGTFSSATYFIAAEYDSGQKEMIQASIIASPEGAKLSIYGRLSTVKLIDLSATVNNSYLILSATPASPTFSGVKVSFTATYSESIGPLLDPHTMSSTVTQAPLDAEYGFSSPNFSVGTDGSLSALNIDATVSITLNGTPFVTQTQSGFSSQFGELTVATLTTSGGVVTIGGNNGSTMDNVDIGTTIPAQGNFTNLTVTEVPTTLASVTNKQYVDSKISALAIALGA